VVGVWWLWFADWTKGASAVIFVRNVFRLSECFFYLSWFAFWICMSGLMGMCMDARFATMGHETVVSLD